MRAVGVSGFQAAPELVEVSKPEPGPGQVLVKVEAGGLNPVDWQIADGVMPGVPELFPLVMGVDFAGRVESVGSGVSRFAVGDAVFGQHFPGGGFAEYVAVPEEGAIARAPESIELKTAAALPTAGMTALDILHQAKVRGGESLLLVGAAGGVGTFLTQLASARDVRVIAVTRGDESVRMGLFGAAVTVDASAESVVDRLERDEYPEGVDVLVDLVSGDAEAFQANAAMVHDGGVALTTRYVTRSGDVRGIENIAFELRASADLLESLAEEVDSGRLKVSVEAEVPLEQAPQAVARNRAGGARGKTIIRP
jgi:NADPH:quinone reductase-like Zn-dependent oxidoreductase